VDDGSRASVPPYVRVMELWTERQATRRLAIPGIGRDAARSALKAGVAGRPVEVGAVLAYDADAVRAALERLGPVCEIRRRTFRPIFVARVAPRTPEPESHWRTWRGADVLAPRSEQLDAVRGWWHLGERMDTLTRGISVARRAESRQGQRYTRRARAFVLGDAGPWFDDQMGRRLTLGSGGPFRLLHGRNRDRST
jgi:hypothetical protein